MSTIGEPMAEAAVKAAEQSAKDAARQAARASLLRQIGEIQSLISEANAIKAELTTVNSNITSASGKWTTGLATFESGAMSAVFVTDKFEGVAAAALQEKLPEPIDKMEEGKLAASDVQEAVSSQISKLNTYIQTKGAMLSSLYGQLQALGA